MVVISSLMWFGVVLMMIITCGSDYNDDKYDYQVYSENGFDTEDDVGIMLDNDSDYTDDDQAYEDDTTLPPGYQFSATIWPRNEMPAQNYEFRVVKVDLTSGSNSFSQIMIDGCKQLGSNWKPVCDHPSYCKNDANAVYLGQDSHLCLPSERTFGTLPEGLREIAHHWLGMCCYTASRHIATAALCNDPPNTHRWVQPNSIYSYVCALPKGESSQQSLRFAAYLGGMNGVEEANYEFQVLKADTSSPSFSQVMTNGCSSLGDGWQPVCNHPSYCRLSSKNSIYIGQTHHLGHGSHLLGNTYWPYGFYTIQKKLFGLCSFTNGVGSVNNALCNYVTTSHSWQAPNPKWYYLCATKTNRGCPVPANQEFTALLGARKGVPSRLYSFQIVRADDLTNAKFSQIMIDGCNNLGVGWKPLCNHPSYCQNDANSIYIGNDHHLSLPAHRYNKAYMPQGMDAIQAKLDGVCTYTNNGNGNNALCNWGLNTHTWQPPTTRAAYVCAKIIEDDCKKNTKEEIVFVMDASSSIPLQGWSAQKSFVSNLIVNDLTSQSEIAIIRFSNQVDVIQQRRIASSLTVRNHIANNIIPSIAFIGGSTHMYEGIAAGMQQFSNTNVNTPPKYLILITDGNDNGPNRHNLCDLQSQNVFVIMIGVGHNVDPTPLNCLLQPTNYFIRVNDWNHFDSVRTQVRNIVCPSSTSVRSTDNPENAL